MRRLHTPAKRSPVSRTEGIAPSDLILHHPAISICGPSDYAVAAKVASA